MATLTRSHSRPEATSIPLSTRMARGFGPGCLAGMRLGDWWKLMAENDYHVDYRYWGKACHITISSLITSPLSWIEQAVSAKAIKSTEVDSPIFILGSWRSGTTHLHNLLCQDPRYSAPDLFQTMYPHTYRLARWWWEPIMGIATPRKRFMDNVTMSLREPAEDEMALGILSRKSNMLSWVFPERKSYYERHLSFEEASPEDRREFQNALRDFITKVQMTNGKPLILKSPNHTARIRLILETFPNARFLHIRRHPYQVFRSFAHMIQQVMPIWGLQTFDMSRCHDMVIAMYRDLYQAYFDQLELIPEGQFHEIAYEDLVESPLEQIQEAYQALNLPAFDEMQPHLQRYLEQTGDYRCNKHREIPTHIRERLHNEWGFCFEAWNYEMQGCSEPAVPVPSA